MTAVASAAVIVPRRSANICALSDLRRVQKDLDCRAAPTRPAARLGATGTTRREVADEIVHHRDAGKIDFVKLKTRSSSTSTAQRRGWWSYASLAVVPTSTVAIATPPRRTSTDHQHHAAIRAARRAISSHDAEIAKARPRGAHSSAE